MNENVQKWLEKAQDDLIAARLTFTSNLLDIACFHAQQAGEKYLKAMLELANHIPPRTHDTEYLADLLESLGVQIPTEIRTSALSIASYAVDARYPGFSVKRDETAEALEAAEHIRDWVLSLLSP